MKKVILTFLLSFFVISLANVAFADNNVFDKSDINKGVIHVNYASDDSKKIKIMIEKSGNKYYYSLLKQNEGFPLQMGNGKYTVTILKQKEGSSYTVELQESFNVDAIDEKSVYLNSIQGIDWENNDKVAQLAKTLTSNAKSEEEKVQIVHDYIMKNIKYDSTIYEYLKEDYIPNISEILENKKGLCYDYSSLFAAMLRSLDIPAKLVKGYKKDISQYHSWNEVFINNNWVTIDCSYDSNLYEGKMKLKMIKDNNEYNVQKIY